MEVTPRVIMLVRHGDYQQWEYKDKKKLTPSGKLQAKEAGEALNRMKDLPPIRRIVTSPMIRALESANIILELLPNVTVTSDYELQEGNPDHLPTRDRFDRVYANYFVPGQETTSTTLLICHANLIRYFLCRYVL